jgi:tetratricopeptide (TPR) repeat protein
MVIGMNAHAAQALMTERFDVAEHMYNRASLDETTLDPALTEELAEILYKLGALLLEKQAFERAARWLERALAVLGGSPLEQLSPDAGESRLGIMQSLAKAYMGIDTPEARVQADHLAGLIEADYPDKPAFLILKLELMLSAPMIDAQQFYHAISRLLRSVVMTACTIRTLFHHIHKLKDLDHGLAGRAVEEVLERLLSESEDTKDWTEKALLLRLSIAVSSPDRQSALQRLPDDLDRLYRLFRQPASETTTHAAQTQVWKEIEIAFEAQHWDNAEAWTRAALHKLFENCGEINRSRLTRKMMQCRMHREDYNGAREAFFQMSDVGKETPITRYLLFKIALRSEDHAFATEQLRFISRSSADDPTLMFACLLDAQNTGNRKLTATALRLVLEGYDYDKTNGVHLPALLRSMVKLLLAEVPKDTMPTPPVMLEICKVFDSAAKQTEKERVKWPDRKDMEFDLKELEWFSRTSYNLAVEHCGAASPQHTVILAESCAQLVEALIRDAPSARHDELRLRQTSCEWLILCAHLAIARTEDNIEKSAQSYLELRKHGKIFRELLPSIIEQETMDSTVQEMLMRNHCHVIKFELEAALHLHQWDEMQALFEQCWKYEDPQQWDTLADLVLVIHNAMVEAKLNAAHLRGTIQTLQCIVTRSCHGQDNTSVLLARWLRCLYQLGVAFDESIGEQCAESASQLAEGRRGTADPYPQDELDWLASNVYNRGVDKYVTGADLAKATSWADRALMLAGSMDDGGEKLKQLKGVYASWALREE